MWFHVWFSNSFVLRIKNNQINLKLLLLLGARVSTQLEIKGLKPVKNINKVFQ
jgi:hypothetical protein